MDSEETLLEKARDVAARLDGRWVADFDELATFAEILIATDFLASPRDVVDYFRTPSRWDPEHEVWVKAGRPRPGTPTWHVLEALFEARGRGDAALAPVQSR